MKTGPRKSLKTMTLVLWVPASILVTRITQFLGYFDSDNGENSDFIVHSSLIFSQHSRVQEWTKPRCLLSYKRKKKTPAVNSLTLQLMSANPGRIFPENFGTFLACTLPRPLYIVQNRIEIAVKLWWVGCVVFIERLFKNAPKTGYELFYEPIVWIVGVVCETKSRLNFCFHCQRRPAKLEEFHSQCNYHFKKLPITQWYYKLVVAAH